MLDDLNEAGRAITALAQNAQPKVAKLLTDLDKVVSDADATVPEVRARILATVDGADALIDEARKAVASLNGVSQDLSAIVAGFKGGKLIISIEGGK